MRIIYVPTQPNHTYKTPPHTYMYKKRPPTLCNGSVGDPAPYRPGRPGFSGYPPGLDPGRKSNCIGSYVKYTYIFKIVNFTVH